MDNYKEHFVLEQKFGVSWEFRSSYKDLVKCMEYFESYARLYPKNEYRVVKRTENVLIQTKP